MILIEDLTSFVLSLLVGIIGLNLVFFSFVLWRRLTRQRFFMEKDAARDRYRPVVQDLYAGKMTPEQAILVLSRATSQPEREAVAALLNVSNPEHKVKATLVLFGLGKVELWSREAFGKKRGAELVAMIRENRPYSESAVVNKLPRYFRRLRMHSVPRALALDNLAQLMPEWAFLFCVEGLLDPSMEVRAMAVRGLGRSKLHAALPYLFKEMEHCIHARSDLSLRGVKTALIEFQLDDLVSYTPWLSHENHRFRFFVIDSAREICNRAAEKGVLNKNDFSPDFYEAILTASVSDEFADVRARAANILKHFRDARAVRALQSLLKDENEFVRLHAVRACADRYYVDLIPDVIKVLKDPKWRVRESAAESLGTIGGGLPELYNEFVKTTDLYQSEQIAEHIQRGGLMAHLIAELHEGGDARKRAFTVCQKLSLLRKTSLLSTFLAAPELGDDVRIEMIRAMSIAPSDKFQDALRRVLQQDPSPQLAQVANAALQSRAMRAGGPA